MTSPSSTSTKLPIFKGTWSLIRFRPWLFFINTVFVTYYFVAQLVPGLVVQRFLDSLTGVNPAVVGLVTLLGMFLLVELSRMAASHPRRMGRLEDARRVRHADVDQYRRQRPAQTGRGTAACTDRAMRSIGLAGDLGDFADFPTWTHELLGQSIFFVLAMVIMARINLPITLIAVLPLLAVFFINRFTWGRFLYYERSQSPDRQRSNRLSGRSVRRRTGGQGGRGRDRCHQLSGPV